MGKIGQELFSQDVFINFYLVYSPHQGLTEIYRLQKGNELLRVESIILERNAILFVFQNLGHFQKQDALMGERLHEVLESLLLERLPFSLLLEQRGQLESNF